MKELNKLRRVSELLKSVLDDKSNLQSAMTEWPLEEPYDSELLKHAKWQLTYVYNDEDLRNKDSAYENKQFEYLNKVYNRISERIDFLKIMEKEE